MQNRDLENTRPGSHPRAETDIDVPLWQIRAMISKLRERAAELDQQISELEWTSQLEMKSGRPKAIKCQSITLRRDTASIMMLRERFLPKKRPGNGGVPIISHTHRAV